MVVEEADAGHQHEGEERRDGDERQDHGKDDHGAQQRIEPRRLLQRDAEQDREHDRGRDGADPVDEVVRHGFPEGRIGEKPPEIAEAITGEFAAEAFEAHRLHQGLQDRHIGEQEKEEERGGQQPQGGRRRHAVSGATCLGATPEARRENRCVAERLCHRRRDSLRCAT